MCTDCSGVLRMAPPCRNLTPVYLASYYAGGMYGFESRFSFHPPVRNSKPYRRRILLSERACVPYVGIATAAVVVRLYGCTVHSGIR